MTLHLEELYKERPYLSPELRARADETPWTQNRLQYVVYRNDDQVAFLSFDLLFEEGFVLYELFVAEEHRRQGIGSALIREAEKIGSSRCYSQLVIRPEPLAKDISKEQLVRWYLAQGFTPFIDQPGLFRKELGCAPASYQPPG
jgi:GNAT superfamily N-acetyltransferase